MCKCRRHSSRQPPSLSCSREPFKYLILLITVCLSHRTELCPSMENKSTYEVWATRYDNKTKECYKTGQKGPCGNNMIFYSLPNDPVYGECDCNYDIECKSLIYSHVYDECFFAYEQVKQSNHLQCKYNCLH